MDEIFLGDRELDVMAVLWQQGSGTVSEVKELLPADLAYTTVLTILRNLEAKGFIRHEVRGKAHRYFPIVARRKARKSALRRVIEGLFQGSPEDLVTHLVEERELSAAQLRRLSQLLAETKKKNPQQGGKKK